MKKIYKIKRKKNCINIHNINIIKNTKINKKKAVLFKNIMFNKKDIIFFSLSGIIKLKKQSNIHRSFVFIGHTARSSIKYSMDLNYPGIFIF
jgi:hypothetical protein